MKTRYTEITYSQFQSVMDGMGFKEIVVEGTHERIWSFVLVGTSYEIRILSSVSTFTGVTRNNGKDAIRVMLWNTKTSKPVMSERVYRTVSALVNTKLKAREIYKHFRDNKCSCGGVLVERVSNAPSNKGHKFMGCSNYPTCTFTVNPKPSAQTELKLNL